MSPDGSKELVARDEVADPVSFVSSLDGKDIIAVEFNSTQPKRQYLMPDHPDANFNEGLARLSMGDFELGWIKHERRWDLPFWRNRRRGFAQPLWRGETEPAGRTVLLHADISEDRKSVV